jgi:V/A-type H+/Na+-transporting ATPase subunit F
MRDSCESGVYKIAVIGDTDSIIGFRALGAAVMEAATPGAAGDLLRQAVDEGFAVIFITEPCFSANQDYIRSLRSRKLPAVIPIPSMAGVTGIGMAQVRDAVRKAVGMDILGLDEENRRREAKE